MRVGGSRRGGISSLRMASTPRGGVSLAVGMCVVSRENAVE